MKRNAYCSEIYDMRTERNTLCDVFGLCRCLTIGILAVHHLHLFLLWQWSLCVHNAISPTWHLSFLVENLTSPAMYFRLGYCFGKCYMERGRTGITYQVIPVLMADLKFMEKKSTKLRSGIVDCHAKYQSPSVALSMRCPDCIITALVSVGFSSFPVVTVPQ